MMLQITLQQISLTLSILHAFKETMRNIQEPEIVVGEVSQITLQFSAEIFMCKIIP